MQQKKIDGDLFALILTIFSYGAIIWSVIRLWIYPTTEDVKEIPYWTALIVFEFTLVHSASLLAAWGKTWIILILVIINLFITAYAWATLAPESNILLVFSVLIFSWLYSSYQNTSKNDRFKNFLISGCSLSFYFALIITITSSPDLIPNFGLTDSFLAQNNYFQYAKGSGLFIDEPKLTLAFCAAYFSVLAIFEIYFYNTHK